MIARSAIVLLVAVFTAGCTTAENPETRATEAHASQGGRTVAQVIGVKTGTHYDLVLLNAGYGRNLRPGMHLTLSRQGKAIASLVIAEATQDGAAALISDLTPQETVQAGDSAQVNTVVP